MTCPRENECIRAVHSGAMAPELARHMGECSDCAEAVRIARTLAASTVETKVQRGDARIVWLLAAERRHADKERKLGRIMSLVPSIVIAAIIAVTAVRTALTGVSPVEGLFGTSDTVAPAFLIAAIFVILVVSTAPLRSRSS